MRRGPKTTRRAIGWGQLPLRTMLRAFPLSLLLAVVSPAQSWAHPLHTAVTKLSAAGGVLSIRIRAFSDDFSAAVARATGTKVLANYQVTDAAAARYVLANVRIENDGTPLALELVRQRRDGEVTWIELRASRVTTVRGAMVLNRLLMDMHADQVNIVKAQYDGRSYTTLFSRGDGAKRMP